MKSTLELLNHIKENNPRKYKEYSRVLDLDKTIDLLENKEIWRDIEDKSIKTINGIFLFQVSNTYKIRRYKKGRMEVNPITKQKEYVIGGYYEVFAYNNVTKIFCYDVVNKLNFDILELVNTYFKEEEIIPFNNKSGSTTIVKRPVYNVIWKNLIGYRGSYQISNTYKIRSLCKSEALLLTPAGNKYTLHKNGVFEYLNVNNIIGNYFTDDELYVDDEPKKLTYKSNNKIIWRDVKGFEGYYMINNNFTVKSIFRNKDAELVPSKAKKRVTLSKDGKAYYMSLLKLTIDHFNDHELIPNYDFTEEDITAYKYKKHLN